MSDSYSFRDLLASASDVSPLIPDEVRATVQRLQIGVDDVSLAGACLGNSVEAVTRLCRGGYLPNCLPEGAKRALAADLHTTEERLSGIIDENREEVAKFLGFRAPSSDPPKPLPKNGCPGFPLFPHQRRALQESLGHLERGRDRMLLHMPTGSGKTRTCMNLVCDHLRRSESGAVLWVASTKELLVQAADEFAEAWSYLGNREVPITTAWEGQAWDLDDLADGFFVASLATLYQFVQRGGVSATDKLGRKLRLIIFDEAHQAIASSYREVVEGLSAAGDPISPVVGLTATPGRSFLGEDADLELAEFFGRTKVMLDTSAEGGAENPVDYLVEHGYLANAEFELIGELPDEDETPTFMMEDQQESGVSETTYLDLVVGTTLRMVNEGHRRVLVFAASVQLAECIACVLRAAGVNANSVHGHTEKSVRDTVIREYTTRTGDPRVLVNYGVLTTGFDAPQTSAAVIARPTRSLVLYSQMVGRAIRGPRAGGNRHATVATVVDPNVPAFGNVARAFTHWNSLWE